LKNKVSKENYDFVVEFRNAVRKCKSFKSKYADIEEIRKQLLVSEQIIEVTDFGQGSGKFKRKIGDAPLLYNRKVKEIASKALKSPNECYLIAGIIEYLKPESILELGTSLGISTSYISRANPASKIISVEGCHQTAAIAEKNIIKTNSLNVKILVSKFEDAIDNLMKNNSFSMAIIDGNHAYEPVMNYFDSISQQMRKNGVIIIDDIRWSAGMRKAWMEIQKRPEVTLSVDFFQIGIVFFNKAFVKEHLMMKFNF